MCYISFSFVSGAYLCHILSLLVHTHSYDLKTKIEIGHVENSTNRHQRLDIASCHSALVVDVHRIYPVTAQQQ